MEEDQVLCRDVEKFLCERNHVRGSKQTTGVLLDKGFEKAVFDREIFIYPMLQECVTPIGYNFCPSEIIISTRTGLPIDIYNKNGKKYAVVAPHDTVLVSTREYVAVSQNIMGTFQSKVKIVSGGFGHISTTLDPGWRGPLLIALNNPTSRKLQLVLSNNEKPEPFVTLIFHRSYANAEKKHDNPPYRTDILEKYLAKPRYWKKVILGKTYENYNAMVKKIRDSMDLTQISETTIKDTYFQENAETERRVAVENLFRNIARGEQLQEFSWDLSVLLQYLKDSLIIFYLKGIAWTRKNASFEQALLPFLDLCYMRIQEEKIGKYWVKEYEEIREMSTVLRHRLINSGR